MKEYDEIFWSSDVVKTQLFKTKTKTLDSMIKTKNLSLETSWDQELSPENYITALIPPTYFQGVKTPQPQDLRPWLTRRCGLAAVPAAQCGGQS